VTNFTPTPEQIAIIEAARNTTDNLCVQARAGAAKTSTLVLVAEALPAVKILCLAFNKAIATEMTARLPSNCTAKTLHGLGYGAWSGFTSKRLQVDGRKSYTILRGLIEGIQDSDEKTEAFELMAETLDMIGKSKQAGWLPESYHGHWKPLCTDDEFFSSLDVEPSDLQCHLVAAAARESFKQALQGSIDFDDMIFCPAICSVSWPHFPLVLVDEAQDLGPINHHILKKLVKSKSQRIIAVGDSCQAIYGFRGADSRSMENLTRQFNMTTLHLTISFRCAVALVQNAQWRAPDMQHAEWAAPGEVHRAATWEASEIEDGDAIICRNNAPLFRMAIDLIQQDRLPVIAGRDIGAPIIKLMKKMGKASLISGAALDAVQSWQDREIKRARPHATGAIKDKAEIIRIMLRRTNTLGNAIAYFEHLLSRDGRIHLMTGHKSKGLEFERVWFLNQFLCNLDEEQDQNLKYVIETRAKNFLAYVTADGFVA
jgi:superfamily I DNA/RNA helicase